MNYYQCWLDKWYRIHKSNFEFFSPHFNQPISIDSFTTTVYFSCHFFNSIMNHRIKCKHRYFIILKSGQNGCYSADNILGGKWNHFACCMFSMKYSYYMQSLAKMSLLTIYIMGEKKYKSNNIADNIKSSLKFLAMYVSQFTWYDFILFYSTGFHYQWVSQVLWQILSQYLLLHQYWGQQLSQYRSLISANISLRVAS